MRKTGKKYRRATSLESAYQLCLDAAERRRRPPKALAELMGIALSTMYRWLADCSMPSNLIRQFEEFCGGEYITEYLSCASGKRILIDIPAGRRSRVDDLAAVQQNAADAISKLARFYAGEATADETVAALTIMITDASYQRQNVLKHAAPELDGMFEDDDDSK